MCVRQAFWVALSLGMVAKTNWVALGMAAKTHWVAASLVAENNWVALGMVAGNGLVARNGKVVTICDSSVSFCQTLLRLPA